MRNGLIANVLALALAGIGTAQAQVYPARPITMVVPLPAGSAFDVTARVLAERMRISLGQSVIVVNGAVLSLPYDVLKDFEPVALIATVDLLIVAKKAVPANNLTSLIGWLKANPNKATQGTGGPGSVTDLAGAFFQNKTGTHFERV